MPKANSDKKGNKFLQRIGVITRSRARQLTRSLLGETISSELSSDSDSNYSLDSFRSPRKINKTEEMDQFKFHVPEFSFGFGNGSGNRVQEASGSGSGASGSGGNGGSGETPLNVETSSSNQLSQDEGSPYKTVITWLSPFDGTLKGYVDFSNQCERCFNSIKRSDMTSLVNFVLSKLSTHQFPVLKGKSIKSWAVLKKALDEHFNIRLTEKFLFRDLTDVKKGSTDSLFDFYNTLVGKCYDYGKFMRTTFADNPVLVKARIEQAEEYILDSFIRAVGVSSRTYILGKSPKNIQEAYSHLRELEMISGKTETESVDDRLGEVLKLLQTTGISGQGNVSGSGNFTNPQVGSVGGNVQQNRETCQVCGKLGHTALRCWKLNEISNRNNNSNHSKNNRNFYNGNNNHNNGRNNYNNGYNHFNNNGYFNDVSENRFNCNQNWNSRHGFPNVNQVNFADSNQNSCGCSNVGSIRNYNHHTLSRNCNPNHNCNSGS